jgi:acyl-homoserine-lactone acylase
MARHVHSFISLAAAFAVSACASFTSSLGPAPEERTATIQYTAHGLPHISAPDHETLAYAVAYAHAKDNVCQTAQQLVTARGERSRFFGSTATALLGRRMLTNDVIDLFVAAHMLDERLAWSWSTTSADAQAQARGYVAGYNRYLADNAGQLPPACNSQTWVQPMTLRDFYRLTELMVTQGSSAALADAIVRAAPPPKAVAAFDSSESPVAGATVVAVADAARALREMGLLDSPLGSNAWAFGKDSTANGSGLLMGNPHFPWAGVNRFWQMHVTIPGQLDVMGAGIGHGAAVQIGFNKDVAWTNTVSTGKRFTLHELTLVPGDPTSYLVDGQPRKMTQRSLSIQVRGTDGQIAPQTRTLWATRFGPVVVLPAAGLNWTTQTAYAMQDALAGNTRMTDTLLAMGKASNVNELRLAMGNAGVLFVNTLAADRSGSALYADLSVVPDVDATHLNRCQPSKPAAALFKSAGLVVLNGSQSNCDWQRDPNAPLPGTIPPSRMPVAVRSDWFHNSNDSFFHSHPAQRFGDISPLVGDASLNRPRTRAGLLEVPALVSRGKVTPQAVQQQLFGNRNFMAHMVLPDLMVACVKAPPTSAEARDGCKALGAWDRNNNLESRGAHLFREFWRTVRTVPGLYRVPFDASQPMATPSGLNLEDATVNSKVWEALTQAVTKVRAAGFALDAPLSAVQRPLITDEPIALHGGDEIEGVLNNLGNQFAPGITTQGLRIDYGTSYLQTVTFDAKGPVAQGLLTYGQSTNPASPHAVDQLRLYSRKEWPVLPFLVDDINKARVGEVLKLVRPAAAP